MTARKTFPKPAAKTIGRPTCGVKHKPYSRKSGLGDSEEIRLALTRYLEGKR